MLTPNAKKVLKKRYYIKDRNENPVEDWPQLCWRVGSHVASVESTEELRRQWATAFAKMIESTEFLPNSPVLKNFGANGGCGSACFVLPIEDDLSDIYDTLRKASLVQKFGGGTGFSFSRLRPKGARIEKTGGISSGPISFAQVFDFSLGEVIKQGGTRNGANMGVLRVDHPDIRDFIQAKTKDGILENFNLSVGITEDFIGAVKSNRTYDLVFNGQKYETVDARQIFDLMVDCAYESGEPGAVFLDTINRKNPLKSINDIEATNPCGEQPLLPYQSCTLGSINLSLMAKGNWVQRPADLDMEKLTATVQKATRFLDNVISKNNYPIAELTEMADKTRQIGLGVMGFADLCIKMHIRYGSPESVQLAERIMRHIYETAKKTSEALAEEKGPFPALEEIVWDDKPRRNALLTSCAPTGTLSLLGNCSGGIEPHFGFNHSKNCIEQSLTIVPEVVKQWIKAHGNGKPLPDFFIEADQVTPDEHLDVQAAFQNNGVDSGVSKTINLPNSASKKDIADAFLRAWDLGLKGVTVYRDGSRKHQALEKGSKSETNAEAYSNGSGLPRGELKPRPRGTSGPTLKMRTACGKLYVSPTFDKDGLQEAFIRTEQGGCEANTKAMGVLLSYFLRSGGSPYKLIRTLKSIKCPACIRAREKGKDIEVQSCPAGLGTSLSIAVENAKVFQNAALELEEADSYFLSNGRRKKAKQTPRFEKCPDCNEFSLKPDSGCVVCMTPGCGFSRC